MLTSEGPSIGRTAVEIEDAIRCVLNEELPGQDNALLTRLVTKTVCNVLSSHSLGEEEAWRIQSATLSAEIGTLLRHGP